MTARSATPATFTVERLIAAPAAEVFAHYSDPALKAAWFGQGQAFDFRAGGAEVSAGENDGTTHRFEARYLDIVPGERIVTAYTMDLNGQRISASIATTELIAEGAGTRVRYTEQMTILDGLDRVEDRESGCRWLIDRLAETVEARAAA